MPTLTANPRQVRVDATALVVFLGPANVTVGWSLIGAGSIAPISQQTDAQGRAYAVYTPDANENQTVTVNVSYGA